jgi:hypothetical protein
MQSSPAHQFFCQLLGEWEGSTRTWFQPNQEPDVNQWRGVFTSLLDGRFVMHEYTGSLGEDSLHGYCIFGFNTMRSQYEVAWIDQFHMDTGMMFSSGKKTEHGFSVLGSYAIGGNQPDWSWRTDIRFVDDQLTISAYNITPDGQEHLGIETNYHRVNQGKDLRDET